MGNQMELKRLTQNFGRLRARAQAGMTLAEVTVALAITGLAVAGTVSGYIYCTTSAQKAGLQLAGNALAMQRIEETRSAKWDTASWPQVDLLVSSNFPSRAVVLDLSGSGIATITGVVNTVIQQISITPPLKRIRVDCIWRFQRTEIITNTIETCRAPDQ